VTVIKVPQSTPFGRRNGLGRRRHRSSGALAPRAVPRRAGVGRAPQMLGMHDERAPGQAPTGRPPRTTDEPL
jgi:hypothetical protein